MGRSEVARRVIRAGTTTPSGVSAHAPYGDATRTGDLALRVDVRHDLRHAAATILLLLATVRSESDDPRTKTAYDGIAHCARSIAEMVDDTDVDHDASVTAPVQIDTAARSATTRASLLYNGVIECDVSPARVLATDTDVARLFTNLLQNSCRAAGAHGTIEVRVREHDEWCELQVGDSGSGFLENVGPGGIGLSSITAIAVRFGGDVTLGRSTLGGALVTVRFPRLVNENPAQHHGGAAS